MAKKDNRRKELAKIHVLKKQVGLDDEDSYRDMLEAQTGKRSAGNMSKAERHKVIKHLQKSVNPNKLYGKPPKNLEASPQWQKVGALLAEQKKSWDYARGIVRQMFKKDNLEFLTVKELMAVITALVKVGEK